MKNVLHSFNPKDKIEPPVFNTIATQSNGIVELFFGIQNHLESMTQCGLLDRRRLDRYKKRVFDLVREKLENTFWSNDKIKILDQLTQKLEQIKKAPNVIAKELLGKS